MSHKCPQVEDWNTTMAIYENANELYELNGEFIGTLTVSPSNNNLVFMKLNDEPTLPQIKVSFTYKDEQLAKYHLELKARTSNLELNSRTYFMFILQEHILCLNSRT